MKTIYIIIIASLLAISSCDQSLFEAEPGNDPEALFENFWDTYNREYSSFDVRNVNWQVVYDTCRPRVTPQTTDAELAEIFKSMLATLDDGHVTLTVPGQDVFKSNRIYRERIGEELFSLELIQNKYMENNYKGGGERWNTYDHSRSHRIHWNGNFPVESHWCAGSGLDG